MSCSNLSSIDKIILLSCAKQFDAPVCAPARGLVRARKKISRNQSWKISRMRTQTCGHPQKRKRSQVVARNRMTSASGLTWFAREPELICGAEGARILTEINRLPQFDPVSHCKIQPAPRFFSDRFPTGPGHALFQTLPVLSIRRISDPKRCTPCGFPCRFGTRPLKGRYASGGLWLCKFRSARSNSSFCCVSTASSAKSPRRSASAISSRSSRSRCPIARS